MVTLRHPTWDDNPERFWELKRTGALTPLRPELEASLPGALLAIARTAMAPRPEDRYQTVAQLRVALVDYQAHAESIALTHRAMAQLAAAQTAHDYVVFAALTARLEQALEMWPGNGEARSGLHAAKRAHALCALEKGDLALAESTIAGIPECGDILEILAAERTRRALRQRHGRLALYGAAILGVALLALFGYYVADYFRYFGKWQMLYHQDFTQQNPDLSGLAFSAYSLTTDEPPGSVGPDGILLKGTHMFWLRNARTSGDVRVEVEMRWPERVDGFEMMINTRREQGASFAYCPTGFACQFGGWAGTQNCISRNDRPQPFVQSNAADASYEVGRTYRLWFQKEGEVVSLFVNGRKVFGTVEPVPIAGAGLDWIGVRAWADAEIRSVSVWRMGSPAKASPLIAGNAFVESGLFALAAQRYLAIAQDHPGTRIEEQALTRAYLVADSVEGRDSIMTAIRATLERNHPRSVYRSLLLENDSRRAWSAGQTERALQLAEQALDDNPNSRIALHLLANRSAQLTPATAQRVLELAGRTSHVASLGVHRLGLTDLSPIARMRLRSLDCSENDIASLEPLRGMPLRRLNCYRNLVRSIEPLRGLPIEDLDLSDNLVEDITPLKGMPLSRLLARSNPLRSIEPLRGLPLVDLNIEATGAESIEPLRGMRLQSLVCNFNRISDLAPLKGMPLRDLHCSGNRISSLEHLAGMPLTTLELIDNDIRDIGPLAGMKLESLDMSLCPVEDLSTLRGMPLSQLSMNDTRVSSLEPLRGMPLRFINLESCPIEDLSPLRGMALRRASLGGSAVCDLEPLRGMPLDMLSCWNVPIASLGPFAMRAPTEFRFSLRSEHWPAAMAAVTKWQDAGDTANARSALVARAFALRDTRALKAQGASFQGRRYVCVPWRVSLHAADSIATRFGGHLVTVTSRPEQEFVLGLLANEEGAWLGIRSDSTGDYWCTGERFEFSDFSTRDQVRRRQPAYLLRHHAIWRHWFRSWVSCTVVGIVIEWEQP
jgi:Leucine-rich repeat (LRR) protein